MNDPVFLQAIKHFLASSPGNYRYISLLHHQQARSTTNSTTTSRTFYGAIFINLVQTPKLGEGCNPVSFSFPLD
jgi:hypothetical protein